MKKNIIPSAILASLITVSNASTLAFLTGDTTPLALHSNLSYTTTGSSGVYLTTGGNSAYYQTTDLTSDDSAPNTSISNEITFTATGLSATESIDLSDIEFSYLRYAVGDGYSPIMNMYIDTGSGYGAVAHTADSTTSGAQAVTTSYTLLEGESITFGFAFADTADSATRIHLIDNFVLNGTVNLDTIPEPSSCALIGLGALSLLSRRKRS